MSRWWNSPIIGVPLFLVLSLAVLTVIQPPILEGHIETLLVDIRFKIRNWVVPPTIPNEILLVVIDEKSLSEYGRWPWNRTRQAELIKRVLQGGPKIVAVDIFYPEPESPDSDRELAALFATNRDTLVMALGFEVEEGRRYHGDLPDALYDSSISRIEGVSLLRPVEAHRVLLPPSPIHRSARFGHVYSLPDRDGKIRKEILYLSFGEEYFPSLALLTACRGMGVPLGQIRLLGGLGVRMGEVTVPTDEFGRIRINYLGREGAFPMVSASDVLSGQQGPEAFKNKIVLIGTTAIATYDLKTTPFSANMAGVEKNATVVANLIKGNPIRSAPLLIDLLVVVFLGSLVLVIGNRCRAMQTILIFLLLAGMFFLFNLLMFACFSLCMNLFIPLVMIFAGGGFNISYRYFTEEKRAREVRRIFSSYVSERVVNELIRNPELTRLGGEKREITVLFADIKGFTTFCEHHEPEEVISLLNEFLEAMTEIIFQWEGTLDKFVGDEIMAFWGAPLPQENHAELAVRCALNMVDRLESLRKECLDKGRHPFEIGVGINSGEVVVGNIGAEGKMMDYTVIGDHVNLGARVEALTRGIDTPILLTAYTVEQVRDLIHQGGFGHCSFQGKGNVLVKGRKNPVGIYALRPLPHGDVSEFLEIREDEALEGDDA